MVENSQGEKESGEKATPDTRIFLGFIFLAPFT